MKRDLHYKADIDFCVPGGETYYTHINHCSTITMSKLPGILKGLNVIEMSQLMPYLLLTIIKNISLKRLINMHFLSCYLTSVVDEPLCAISNGKPKSSKINN